MVVLAGAHAASSAPGIQKRGWGAAVPGIVLVAWMPLMSEVPGTGLEGMTFGVAGSGSGLPRASGMDRLVMKEVGGEAYLRTVFGDAPGPSRLGWISRRLLFLLARTEDISVITDSTTAKGHAYKHAISSAVNSGRASVSEARWAHGVAHIEAEPDRAYGVGELVRGDFRIRRLLLGGYTLSGSVGSNLVEFRCWTPNNLFGGSGFMPSGTPEELAAYWIKRFSWDSVHEAERARGLTYTQFKHPLGQIEIVESGAAVRLHYAVMVNEARHGEPQRMAHVGTVKRYVPVRVDEGRVIDADGSAQTKAWLESKLRAELTVEHDSTRQAWVPIVRLRWNGARDLEDTLLFGGMVSVDYVMDGSPIDQGRGLLESGHDETWWLVEPAQQGRRSSQLVARSDLGSRFAGEVEGNYILPSARNRLEYRLVVRITPMQGNTPQLYGGLWADRVYDGALVVPLDNWTLDEVRRYIVSGVVPDHAMP
jgi:hypothetical protein